MTNIQLFARDKLELNVQYFKQQLCKADSCSTKKKIQTLTDVTARKATSRNELLSRTLVFLKAVRNVTDSSVVILDHETRLLDDFCFSVMDRLSCMNLYITVREKLNQNY